MSSMNCSAERVALPESGSYVSVIRELYDTADRSAAIVGCAFVESSLEKALLAVLQSDSTITDRLFGPDGACGGFSTKIDLGKLMGLYGAIAHSDLHIIRYIRNQFAHSLSISDFKSKGISDLVAGLRLCERYTADSHIQKSATEVIPLGERDSWSSMKDRSKAFRDPRQRYLMTVEALTIELSDPPGTPILAPCS